MDKKIKKEKNIKNTYNKDEAVLLLNRIDSWINNCDTKFSILIAILGVFFALMVNIFSSFTKLRIVIEKWEEVIVVDKIFTIISSFLTLIYIILIGTSVIVAVLGINAKVNNKSNNPLFFGSIAQYKSFKNLEDKLSVLDKEQYLTLINEQIYTNSKICSSKFKYYKKALWTLFPAILVAIINMALLFFI